MRSAATVAAADDRVIQVADAALAAQLADRIALEGFEVLAGLAVGAGGVHRSCLRCGVGVRAAYAADA